MPYADNYLDPYRISVREHGQDHFKATLWASPRSQRVRFRVFSEMCFLPGKRLLDAGCGRGDLAAYLLEHGIEYEHYVGVDGLPEVIDYARQQNLPRAEFHYGDFLADPVLLSLGRPQVICISGSLNTMADEQVMAVLEAAWSATSEALLFNFLSDRTGVTTVRERGPARRLNTIKLMDWALTRTDIAALRHDYFRAGHDATILMRKTDESGGE